MNAATKNSSLTVAALAISAFPLLFSGTVFRAIRLRFNTVGIQTPVQDYSGDVVFFLVAALLLLVPWVTALALRIRGIPDWAASIPLIALLAYWLLNKQERPADSAHLSSWVAFMGYAGSVIGSAGSEREGRPWIRLIWLPSMFFLIFIVVTGWWLDVFFE